MTPRRCLLLLVYVFFDFYFATVNRCIQILSSKNIVTEIVQINNLKTKFVKYYKNKRFRL